MPSPVRRSRPRSAQGVGLAAQALRVWTPRQAGVAVVTAVVVGLVIGVATVLIPNPVFARDIPPVWWNYPVWVLTSVLSGMLVATYVRPDGAGAEPAGEEALERRTSRMGMAGGVLAWMVNTAASAVLGLLVIGTLVVADRASDVGTFDRNDLRVFETDFGRIAINICYDVEFPEIARAAAREGCRVVAVDVHLDTVDRHGEEVLGTLAAAQRRPRAADRQP